MDPETMARTLSAIEEDHERRMAEHAALREATGVGTAHERLRQLPARVAADLLRRAEIPPEAPPLAAPAAGPQRTSDRDGVPLSLRTFSYRTLGR